MDHIELQGLSIALIGSFNPAIFNPDWLMAQGVVSAEEVADSKIEVIHSQVAQFTISDFVFDIQDEKFILHCTAEPFVRAADIVAVLFAEKLSHTPVTALGINYLAHFKVKDWAMQNALGRALAPLDAWGDFGAALEAGDVMEKTGGLVSLTMQQQKPDDRGAGFIRAMVQPSHRITPPGTGVFMQINDHYERQEGDPSIAEILSERITPSLERSRAIVTQIESYAWSLS